MLIWGRRLCVQPLHGHATTRQRPQWACPAPAIRRRTRQHFPSWTDRSTSPGIVASSRAHHSGNGPRIAGRGFRVDDANIVYSSCSMPASDADSGRYSFGHGRYGVQFHAHTPQKTKQLSRKIPRRRRDYAAESPEVTRQKCLKRPKPKC